jgi:hypothetical protein
VSAKLTPFPDGVGYLEYGWDNLSEAQIQMLVAASKRGGGKAYGRITTVRALRRFELLDHDIDPRITQRGRDLVEWARKTGRIR